jgi:hypothetical protein
MYNSSGINSTVTTNFINTKAAEILYPRLMSDITIQIDRKSYPFKQNMETAWLNDFFHSAHSIEDSQCKGHPQTWGVRGRLDRLVSHYPIAKTICRKLLLRRARQDICVHQAASELHFNNECSGEDQWKHEQLVIAERRRP